MDKTSISNDAEDAFIVVLLGQIKKISVFRVTGLKILGRIGTHIFCNYFFF